MDEGLLVIRVVLGVTMMAHGVQKVFGWFEGPGFRNYVERTRNLGFRPALPTAVVHSGSELIGGLLLLTGLMTALASAATVGVMIMAVTVITGKKGFFAGWELNLVIAASALGIAFTGPGAYSLDEYLGIAWQGPMAGLSALALAVAAAGATLILRKKPAASA